MNPRLPLWFWIALATIVACGVWLRTADLGASLWLDELHTDWATGGNLASVADRAAQGNQPSLYFWLIWLVRQVWDSEIVLRLPSLVASGVIPFALLGLWWIALRQEEPSPADAAALAAPLLTAWWWATDDTAIFFGQEARPYALVQLAGALQFGMGWRLVTRPALVARVAFWLLSLALIYLHYTAGLLLLGELSAYACWTWFAKDDRPAYRGWPFVCDAAVFLLLLIPGLPRMAGIFAQRDDWKQFVTVPNLGSLLWQYPACLAALALLTANRGKRSPRLLIAVAYLAPLLAALAATWLGFAPVFFPRYLAALAPLGWLALGLVPTVKTSQRGRWALVAVIALLPLATSQQLQHLARFGQPFSEHTEDWRGAIAHLQEQLAKEPVPVLVGARLIEAQRLKADAAPAFREYLLFPVRGRYCLTADSVLPLAGPPWRLASPHDRDEVVAQRGAWVIARISEDQVAEAQSQLSAELSPTNVAQEQVRAFGEVQVWRLRVTRGD